MKKSFLFPILFVACFFTAKAQTTLSSGDIAILFVQTRGADDFAFVTFVDILPGTVIYFTDCGADAAGFNNPCTEGAFSYTVPAGGLTAGDIIQYTDNPSIFVTYTDSRITGTSFLLSTIGDQVIAFQDASNSGGSANAANNPRFIFVNNVESTIFAGDKMDTNETGLPSGLTDIGPSRTALGLGAGPGPGDEFDIAIYNSTYDFSSSGISAARLAFSNLANYYQTDTEDATYTIAFNNIPSALTLTTCADTDTTPPAPDVASLPDVTAQCEVTALTPPTATDNCGGTVTVTNNATLPMSAQGTTVVTWTYDDGNGNTATQNQNIIVDDTTPPTPDAASLPNVTAQCEVTALTPPTATDNCGGTVTVTNNATLPITAQGTTAVTWTYDDGNGNTATQNQNVILDDTTPPTPDVAFLLDVTAQCEVTALTPPTATDNCGGTVTVTNNVTLPITAQGTTAITWTYDDGNGNTSTQNQNVILDDTTPPTPDVASLSDVTAQCEVTALTPPTATDNCGGTVTVTNNVTLPITAQGTTLVTWTYDDGKGNTATQNQNIIIDDTAPPTPDVASLPNVTAQCEVTALTPPTATDNCGGIVTVTNNTTLPITEQGTTVITWTYDDGNGNTATQNQNVIIDDTTPPTPDVASLSDVTAQCEVTALTPPTATDNCGGTVMVTNNAILPITSTTVVIWTYDDGNGNTATQNQNIIITDVTPPVINCPSDFTEVGDSNGEFILPDYSALVSDNCSTGVNLNITQSPLPSTILNDQSTTLISITATDQSGNSNQCSFNITVDSTLGLDDFDFSDYLKLYPNPVSNELNIESSKQILTSISLFDIQGRLISNYANINVLVFKIDTSDLESSTYFVRLKTTKGSTIKRFIKN